MTPQLELADQLAGQLFRLIRTVERTKAQVAAARGDGLERACFALLVELVERGPRRTTALAEAVFADPSTVSRQVGQLVQLGFVERQADPDDGRASRLAATERGTAHLAESRARRNEWLAAVLTGWSHEDTTQLVHLMDRLNDGFEEHRPQLLATEQTQNQTQARVQQESA